MQDLINTKHPHPILKNRGRKISTRLCLLILSTALFVLSLLSSFTKEGKTGSTNAVRDQFVNDLKVLHEEARYLTESIKTVMNPEEEIFKIRESFYKVKETYKKVEYLTEYLDPEIAKNLNGAPIPRILVEQEKYQTLQYTEPSVRTFPPEGLQVLEEVLFAEPYNHELNQEAVVLAVTLQEQVLLFKNQFNNQPLTHKQITESVREELIRIMTLGITGFDAPAAGREIDFCATALQSAIFAMDSYSSHSDPQIRLPAQQATDKMRAALEYLNNNQDFDTFNRLYFIKELADPAYGLITKLQQALLHSKPSFSKPVNNNTLSLFSKNFLQTGYYAKQDQGTIKEALPELGKLLFFDPLLSGNNERSCASCHNPSKAFTDGVAKSTAFDFKGTVSRNAPTLINSVFSTRYFWDSRARYLQDQVPAVLLKEDELHGSYEEVVQKLNQSREYKKMFKEAFADLPNKSINTNTINRAIAAYIQSLVALDSDFDKYMRGEKQEIDPSVARGFNLFMGKAECGTCHFAPVFNGTVPPKYTESESEILGVPAVADLSSPSPDRDSGKAAIIPAEVLMHAFKTPTVRNAELTAPYMHNGVFSTMEEVIEFYDLGGGAGIGIDIPNQTLPAEPLNLSDQEKKDLISFMQALTDTTSISTEVPEKLPEMGRKSALNARVIGGKY